MNQNLLKSVLKPIRCPQSSTFSKSFKLTNEDLTPSHWKNYFDECKDIFVKESNATFRVYFSGFNELVENIPTIVLLHGGGYSGLTWSLFVKSLRNLCDCRIIALDLRGHGSTQTDDDYNLSIETLVNDVYNLLVEIFCDKSENDNFYKNTDLNEISYKPEKEIKLPPLLLVGHSMGGALAVHVSYKLSQVCQITGMIVIDVVEGTALEALHSMNIVLKNRRNSFNSIKQGIEWCVNFNQTKNLEAAKISFPGQIKNKLTGQTATDELDNNDEPIQYKESSFEKIPEQNINNFEPISEENELENNDEEFIKPKSKNEEFNKPIVKTEDEKYVWKIDLFKTEPYWKSWFENLSELFLNSPSNGRLLLLAGIDRLDKKLTIGQMQGKFQMQVLPQSGHAVHEDVPEKVAEAIATYLVRNKLVKKKTEFNSTFPCC